MNARLAGERISYLEASASLAYVRFTGTCNQKRNQERIPRSTFLAPQSVHRGAHVLDERIPCPGIHTKNSGYITTHNQVRLSIKGNVSRCACFRGGARPDRSLPRWGLPKAACTWAACALGAHAQACVGCTVRPGTHVGCIVNAPQCAYTLIARTVLIMCSASCTESVVAIREICCNPT